jgi:hypothetical protein
MKTVYGWYVKECVMKAAEILHPEKQHFFNNQASANTIADHINDWTEKSINILWHIQLQLMRVKTLQMLHSFILF